MDVLAEIKALRERLDALEKLAKEPKPEPGPFTKRPVHGETYFFLRPTGEVDNEPWADHRLDEARWKRGNVFNTREDASAANEARVTLATLRQQPGRAAYKKGEVAYAIDVSETSELSAYRTDMLLTRGIGRVRFCSMEAAQAAIDAVGKERILELVMWENKQ